MTSLVLGAMAVSPTVAASAMPAAGHPVARPVATKPPPNPTDAQLQAAANDKTKLAQLIGVINGQIAADKVEQAQRQAKLEYAEQLTALRLSQKQKADTAARNAKAAVTRAAQKSAAVRRVYVRTVQASYYGADDSADTTTGALLTSNNPTQLLERTTLVAYQAHDRSTAIKTMQTAQVTTSNAEAKARTTKAAAAKAAKAASSAEAGAATLYRASVAAAATDQSTLDANTTLLTAAQSRLATLNGQRVTFLAYQKKQAEIAAAKARALARDRAAAAAARARAEAQAAAEAAAAARRHHHHGGGSGSSDGGSGSSGGGGSSFSSPSAPSGGSWTAAKGRAAAKRAKSTLGIMYAWAGGNAYGPTRGVCAGDGAYNDCNVIGYDCSGLAMYAWGQSWDHFAATQYYQAGSYHPSVDNLMPGDLLFWSYGSLSDIHHVAVYVGHGEMVEAPESNVPIRTASIYEYGPITGITRPLT